MVIKNLYAYLITSILVFSNVSFLEAMNARGLTTLVSRGGSNFYRHRGNTKRNDLHMTPYSQFKKQASEKKAMMLPINVRPVSQEITSVVLPSSDQKESAIKKSIVIEKDNQIPNKAVEKNHPKEEHMLLVTDKDQVEDKQVHSEVLEKSAHNNMQQESNTIFKKKLSIHSKEKEEYSQNTTQQAQNKIKKQPLRTEQSYPKETLYNQELNRFKAYKGQAAFNNEQHNEYIQGYENDGELRIKKRDVTFSENSYVVQKDVPQNIPIKALEFEEEKYQDGHNVHNETKVSEEQNMQKKHTDAINHYNAFKAKYSSAKQNVSELHSQEQKGWIQWGVDNAVKGAKVIGGSMYNGAKWLWNQYGYDSLDKPIKALQREIEKTDPQTGKKVKVVENKIKTLINEQCGQHAYTIVQMATSLLVLVAYNHSWIIASTPAVRLATQISALALQMAAGASAQTMVGTLGVSCLASAFTVHTDSTGKVIRFVDKMGGLSYAASLFNKLWSFAGMIKESLGSMPERALKVLNQATTTIANNKWSIGASTGLAFMSLQQGGNSAHSNNKASYGLLEE